MRAKRRFAIFCLCLLVCCCARAITFAADEQQLVERLRKQWLEEASSVKTAELQVEFFQLMDHAGQPVSREQMERFLQECRTVWSASGDSAAIREKSRTLNLSNAALNQCWEQGTIRVEGRKVRNSFVANLIPGARYQELDACFDGSVDVHFVKESRQAWVTEQGPAFKRFGLRDVWCLGPTQDKTTFVERSGTRVTLESPPARYVVDTETGAVVEVRVDSGKSSRTITQFGFGRYDVGNTKVIVPSVCASVDYSNNKVHLASLFIVKSARFNQPLAPDAFSIPLPQNSKAVYYASPDKIFYRTIGEAMVSPPFLMTIDKPIDDARSLLPKLRAGAESKKPLPASFLPAPKSRTWPTLLIVNIVAGVLLVIWVFLRRSRAS